MAVIATSTSSRHARGNTKTASGTDARPNPRQEAPCLEFDLRPASPGALPVHSSNRHLLMRKSSPGALAVDTSCRSVDRLGPRPRGGVRAPTKAGCTDRAEAQMAAAPRRVRLPKRTFGKTQPSSSHRPLIVLSSSSPRTLLVLVLLVLLVLVVVRALVSPSSFPRPLLVFSSSSSRPLLSFSSRRPLAVLSQSSRRRRVVLSSSSRRPCLRPPRVPRALRAPRPLVVLVLSSSFLESCVAMSLAMLESRTAKARARSTWRRSSPSRSTST